jgi:hypothetical protein
VDVYPILILLFLLLLYTKALFIGQACQSGHFAADYANAIYLRQFKLLKDLMPDRHQI